MNKLVSVVITTYNNRLNIDNIILSAVDQTYKNISIIIVDDGSSDGSPEHLKSMAVKYPMLKLVLKDHGERGLAREAGINLAKELKSDYLLFLDDDMIMQPALIESCLDFFYNDSRLGALVIPEKPYSDYKNFYSKVKVFERTIINNAGKKLGKNSIEAARFWAMSAYDKSGGLNPSEISFEETQPTIRYSEQGGLILRAYNTYLLHDEKRATLKEILSKKRYYFNQMNKTLDNEENGFIKALSRWYFFRPVLYRFSNILYALKHPILTLGMFFMYLCLTFIGVIALFRKSGA